MAFKMKEAPVFKHTGKKATHPGTDGHTGHLRVKTTEKKKPRIKMTTTSKPKT